jgi:hypothetical protein
LLPAQERFDRHPTAGFSMAHVSPKQLTLVQAWTEVHTDELVADSSELAAEGGCLFAADALADGPAFWPPPVTE